MASSLHLLVCAALVVAASAAIQTCSSSPCLSHAVNADFTIIVDVSNAHRTNYNFLLVQSFLANFTAGLTLSPEDSQIALYTYSLYTKTYTTLSNGSDPVTVQKAIQSITFDNSGDRQLFQALNREELEVTRNNGLRTGYKHILLLISADKWTGTAVLGSSLLQQVQAKYDLVMAIGLSNGAVSNQAFDLQQFTGNPSFVFFSLNYDQLTYAAQWVYNYACPGTHMTTSVPTTTIAPTADPSVTCKLDYLMYDVFLIVDISASMSASDFSALKNALLAYVNPFPVNNNYTQFALVGTSIDSELYYIGFHQGQDRGYVMNTISTLTQDGSTGQTLQLSLQAIDRAYLQQNYLTPNKLVVYVTGTTAFDTDPNAQMKALSQKYGLHALALQWSSSASASALSSFTGGSDCVYQATTSATRQNAPYWLQNKMCAAKFCI